MRAFCAALALIATQIFCSSRMHARWVTRAAHLGKERAACVSKMSVEFDWRLSQAGCNVWQTCNRMIRAQRADDQLAPPFPTS